MVTEKFVMDFLAAAARQRKVVLNWQITGYDFDPVIQKLEADGKVTIFKSGTIRRYGIPTRINLNRHRCHFIRPLGLLTRNAFPGRK